MSRGGGGRGGGGGGGGVCYTSTAPGELGQALHLHQAPAMSQAGQSQHHLKADL